MKPRFLGFGVLCMAVAFSPAHAELLSKLLGVLAGPSSPYGVAVPRPLGATGTAEPSPPAALEELPQDFSPSEGDGVPVPTWDFKRLDILGVDRTQFPEILVLFAAKDAMGFPETKVDRDLLRLTEDEAPQPVLGVEPTIPTRHPGDPLSVAILIDSSGSMQRYLDSVQAAAIRFTQRLREGDQGAVVGFCNQPILLTPLTEKKWKLEKGIHKISPRGFTAMYDAIRMGAQNLKDCGGTRAMVLISDGRDEDGTGRQLSRTSLETAISAAKKAKMPVFAIGIGQDVGRPILERIADETGGGYLHSPEGQDLDRLYTEIARRLGRGDEGYFKLVYRSTHPEKDGSTRTIVLWNDKTRAVANYPAPRGLLWPLTKGF